MIGEIVDSNIQQDSELVKINDSTQLSMKQFQSIYNEITGKTERLRSRLNDSHVLDLGAIAQLNTKINQLYEQYAIISSNCKVTVYHVNDCSERFTSFERFKIYDQSTNSPCENINITYDFVIILPKTNAPQAYKISIDLHSRIGMKVKAQKEHGMTRRMMTLFARRTGVIEIDYIDYTVARNFMIAINEWYSSSKSEDENKVITFLQNSSNSFSFAFKAVTILLVSLSLYQNNSKLITDTPTLETIYIAGIIAFTTIYLSGLFAAKLGQYCEYAIDSYQSISGLLLNSADEKAYENFNKANLMNIVGSIVAVLGVIIVNIFSNYISTLLLPS